METAEDAENAEVRGMPAMLELLHEDLTATIRQTAFDVHNYLKVTGIEVGLLLNFGQPTLEVKRLALSAPSASSAVPSSLHP